MSDEIQRLTIEDVAERAGLTHEGGRRFVEALIGALKEGHTVTLRRLGQFRVTELEARVMDRPGFLPGSGRHEMPRKRVARFRSAPKLKELLQEG